MKKISIALVLALALQFLVFSQETMKVEIGNFKISLPVGWMAQYTGNAQVFFLFSPLEKDDTFQENCNLTPEPLNQKISLEDYIKTIMTGLDGAYSNMKVIEAKDNYRIITGEINETVVEQMLYFYITPKVAYVLTFTATPDSFADYVDTFRKIAASFKY